MITNYGNMQIGDRNVLNVTNGNDLESQWKYLETLLTLSEKSKGNEQQQTFIKQLQEHVTNKNPSGIRSTIKEYGMGFVVSTLSNVAGGELLKLLNSYI